MRRLSTERIEQFAWLEYLFLECNHIICIFSLLVVCNVTIWCKWFFWTRVLDITGYTGHTLELIAFDNAVNYLRPLHVPNLTKLTTSYSNPQYCLIWIDWNFVLQKQPPEVFYKKGALTNFAKFTLNHLCQNLFFNKVAGLNNLKGAAFVKLASKKPLARLST